MRNEQDALERRLWLDRGTIYTKYQEKIKVAQTKLVPFILIFFAQLDTAVPSRAQMIGVVISQHELNVRKNISRKIKTDTLFHQMITDAFKKELSKFDLERVIPAWDGLVSRQQLELAQLNVPTMCVVGDSDHLQVRLRSCETLMTISFEV